MSTTTALSVAALNILRLNHCIHTCSWLVLCSWVIVPSMSTYCLCVSELFSRLILIVKLQSCFLLFMFFCYHLFPSFHYNFSSSFYACLWQRVLLLELASSVHSSCSKTNTSRSCCNCYGICVLSYILYIRTLSTQTLNW